MPLADPDHDLLVQTHTYVKDIWEDLHGNGQTGLIEKVAVLQTQMAERTIPPDKRTAARVGGGVSALVALVITGFLEALRRMSGG